MKNINKGSAKKAESLFIFYSYFNLINAFLTSSGFVLILFKSNIIIFASYKNLNKKSGFAKLLLTKLYLNFIKAFLVYLVLTEKKEPIPHTRDERLRVATLVDRQKDLSS